MGTRTITPSFPQFSQLPPELRMMVWEQALPTPRVLQPYTLGEKDKIHLNADISIPPVLQVLRESRRVCTHYGDLKSRVCGSSEKGWLSPSDEVLIHIDTVCRFQDLNLGDVRHLAFPQCLFSSPKECARILQNIQQWAPKCETIKLYLCRSAMQPSRRSLYQSGGRPGEPWLVNSDPVGSLQILAWKTAKKETAVWADLRQMVEETWKSNQKLLDIAADLPTVIGVQAYYC